MSHWRVSAPKFFTTMRTHKILALILAPTLALASCGGGTSSTGASGGASGSGSWGGPGAGSGGGNNGGGGGGNTATLTFGGPSDAAPTAIETVAVTWDPAILTAATGDDVLYDVYRADNAAMTGELLLGTTTVGVSSYIDAGLTQGQTYFYRVAARTTESGLVEEPEGVVSANLPLQPTGTPIDYTTAVAPIWLRLGSDGVTTCLDCHDGAIAQLDLRTWEGLMIGMGTPTAPDSFVTPGFGEASWKDLVSRVLSHPGALNSHKMWVSQIADFQAALTPWIDEGATEAPDTTVPEFNAADLADTNKYTVEGTTGIRVAVRFPHAIDPESTPYGPQSFDHLRYSIFAGETSNTIDWSSRFRGVPRSSFPTSDESYVLLFDWAPNTGVFVVRASDWFTNTTVSEVELHFERAAVN